jgi:hypothetical protein
MVDIKSSSEEILHQQEIVVTLIPEAGAAILKKHLSFSINNPHIMIKRWKAQDRAQLGYIAAFRKEKKLYVHPVSITLVVEFLSRDKSLLQQSISCSHVNISFLELCKDGNVRPKNILVALTKQMIEKPQVVIQEKDIIIKKEEIKHSNVIQHNFEEVYNIKPLLNVSVILFVIALLCFFERSRRFVTVQFIVGIFLMCFAVSFVVKILFLQRLWPFHWF